MMTAENLALIAGVLLSLGFSYIPGLQPKYDKLPATTKRLIMLALLALAAGGTFGLACSRLAVLIGLAIPCDLPGAIGLLRILILAIIANQATYAITPQIKDTSDALRRRQNQISF